MTLTFRAISSIILATVSIHLEHVSVYLHVFRSCLRVPVALWPFVTVVAQLLRWAGGERDSHAVTEHGPVAVQLCEQLDRARYQQTESAGDVTLYPRRNYSTTIVLVAITPQIIINPSNTADFQTTSSNLHYNTSHSIICQVSSNCLSHFSGMQCWQY